MGGLTMARGGDSWEALMITLLMWGTLLGGAGAWVSSCTGTGGTCACGSSSTSCQLVTVADITLTGGICLWTNLAGQTPDVNVNENTPKISNFACMNTADQSGSNLDSSVSGQNAANYYALPTEVNVSMSAAKALEYYTSFNDALTQYNCEEQ